MTGRLDKLAIELTYGLQVELTARQLRKLLRRGLQIQVSVMARHGHYGGVWRLVRCTPDGALSWAGTIDPDAWFPMVLVPNARGPWQAKMIWSSR